MGNCLATPDVKDEKSASGALAALSGADGGGKDENGEPASVPRFGRAPSALQRPMLGRTKTTDVTDKYEIQHVLGRGAFGTTRLCVDKLTGARFACKSILKARLEAADAAAGSAAGVAGGSAGSEGAGEAVRRELDVMLHLRGQRHVVQVVDSFEDNAYVHMIMELCEGGDLVHRITTRGSYTERDAAHVTRTLLEVLAYAHDMGVVHRDIKPDNCLMMSDADDALLKLADWGFACFYNGRRKLRGVAGTCYYIAPEVVMGEYDEKVDIWSAGVMLYVLLCGAPPFYAVRDDDVFRRVVDDGVPPMSAHPWPTISEGAKDAVRRMMTYCPNERPSAREMLQHEWVRADGTAGDNELQPEVLVRMRSYAAMNNFKRHAAMVIAGHLPFDEIRGLKELFESIDEDGSGTITTAELLKAVEARGCAIPKDDLMQLMQRADVNGDGELDYAEFLAATLDMRRMDEEDSLMTAFKNFDEDGDGRITLAELKSALDRASHVTPDAAEKIMHTADADGDGVIDYAEFVRVMRCGHDGDGGVCMGHRHVIGRAAAVAATAVGAGPGAAAAGAAAAGENASSGAGGGAANGKKASAAKLAPATTAAAATAAAAASNTTKKPLGEANRVAAP